MVNLKPSTATGKALNEKLIVIFSVKKQYVFNVFTII